MACVHVAWKVIREENEEKVLASVLKQEVHFQKSGGYPKSRQNVTIIFIIGVNFWFARLTSGLV